MPTRIRIALTASPVTLIRRSLDEYLSVRKSCVYVILSSVLLMHLYATPFIFRSVFPVSIFEKSILLSVENRSLSSAEMKNAEPLPSDIPLKNWLLSIMETITVEGCPPIFLMLFCVITIYFFPKSFLKQR